jgi:glutathione synthase/RimK-type ligase-like ATP-grasp enzyme
MTGLKHFIFAGIDLLLGKDKNIYFIEANSAPFGLPKFKEVYGVCRPLKDLVRFLKPYSKKKIAILYKLYGREAGLSLWNIKELQKDLPLNACMWEWNLDNLAKGNGSLVDDNGKKVKPDILLRQHGGRPYAQEKAGVRVINPTCILKSTKNKMVTNQAVRRYAPDVACPTQFLVKKKEDLAKIIRKNKLLFAKGFALKPLFGTCSEGVMVLDSLRQLPQGFRLKEQHILENRIMPLRLFGNKFFDIRSYAVDGKYSGSMIRVSKEPVTGISAGGYVVKTPKKYESAIKKATEKVTAAVDRCAEDIRTGKIKVELD